MKEYNELINSFCQLQKDRKQVEIKQEIKEIFMVLYRLCENNNIDYKPLLHKEMKKIEQENISEEDFLNAVYAYVISIKSMLGQNLE